MAGTSHVGSSSIDPALGWDQAGDFIGNINGSKFGWKQSAEGSLGGQPRWHDAFPFLAGGGVLTTAGASGGSPAAPTSRPAIDEAGITSFSDFWHEQVHILPRTKVEFGNIITLVTSQIELYSAFRNASVTMTAVVNNASPGVELPDITPPVVMPRLTSILSPSSTGNSGGTGLGTLVKITVNALPDGLPTFDTNIVFNFSSPANDPELFVSGTRIVMIPFKYEDDVDEQLAFLTEVIDSLSGKEQRIAYRKNPRQSFDVRYALDGLDRQRMQALLFDWMGKIFGFPVRTEILLLTAPTSVGATLYSVAGADDVDLRVGGLAAVISDAVTFDVINIQAQTDTLITAADVSLNAYPAGTEIMPLRTATVPSGIPFLRQINNLEDFRITFQVKDNDTGALTGDVTPGFWSTFNGRVLFDDCNVVDGAMSGELLRKIYRIDNKTGRVDISSNWDRSKRASSKGFLARNRAELMALRKLFIGLVGKQKAFYLPTFIEEFTPVADLVSGLATMDISSIGYTRFVQARIPFTVIHLTFTDGTSLDRTAQSSIEVDVNTERLTMTVNWPANRTVAEIERMELYELVRFDSDVMNLQHSVGKARTRMPVMRVFDDNA